MTREELELLLRTETDRVEWKQSAKQAEDVLHPACALANDLGDTGRPGYVLYGVSKNGTVVGIDDRGFGADKIQQQTSNRLTSTAIIPTPSFDLETVEADSGTVLVLRVVPYPVPPVVMVNGRAWVRQGTTTRQAREADLLRLRERRPENLWPFDTRPVPTAVLGDLDLRMLKDEYDAERSTDPDDETFPSIEDWLSSRKGLGARLDGTWRPNAAAILLHGKSPQDWFPGATVEFVRYAGFDVDAFVSSRRTATGPLPAQLETAWSQIEAHLDDVPSGPGGIREGFAPRYPLEALKELVRNLVQHRLYEGTNAPGRIEWYDDRIEFSNPGGPFGAASEGIFGDHSDYRNPNVTRGLVDLGYVQQLARGIRRVRLQLERNGNPPLEVETDGFTRVIVLGRSAE